MEKIDKGFWGNEIVICGCTKADNAYYKRLYKHFTANQVQVYALPTHPESELGFETYPDLSALPHIPECAFVLCEKEGIPSLARELIEAGVRRILFYSKTYAEDAVIAECQKAGVEVRVGCPLMLYASGPCYLHAAVGGVLEERKKK